MNVFLSYAAQNRSAVKKYHERLSQEGDFRIFWDQDNQAGENWPERLAKELSHADRLVVFVSPVAAASKFVVNEVLMARNRGAIVTPITIEPLPDFDGAPALLLLLASVQTLPKGTF